MNNKKVYWLLLVVFGGVFYVMNYFTPMGGDDYAYCFYFDNFSTLVRPTPERVTSFGMAVESMWNHYHIVNGRFISHLVLQCFCALLGKPLFNVVNTLIFIAFLHVIVLLSKHRNSLFVLSVAFIVSMCLLPYPGQTMLWMAGAVNYLWPATIALWYVYWLQNYVPQKEKVWKHIIVGMLTLIIAWTNESISAPIAFGLFLYFLSNFKLFRGFNVSAFIGYAIGSCLVVFAPGTFARISNDPVAFQPLGIDQFLFIHTYYMLHNFICLVFPIVALLVFCVKFFKGYIKHPLKIFGSLYGCLFFAFVLFLWGLGMIDFRIFFGVTIFSFVIAMRWMNQFIQKLEVSRYVVMIVCLLCIAPSYCAVSATYKYYVANKKATELVLSSPNKCIIPKQKVPEYSRFCFYVGMESLTPCRYTHSRVKALYWGKDYIQALPEEVYDAWKNDSIMQLTSVNVMQLLPEQVVRHKTQAIYKYPDNTNELLPRQRLIRRLFGTLSIEAKKDVYYVEQDDCYYLIFPKDDNAISIEVPILEDNKEKMIEYKPTM